MVLIPLQLKFSPARGLILIFSDKRINVDSSNGCKLQLCNLCDVQRARKAQPYLSALFLWSNREGLNLIEFSLSKSVK